MRTVAIIQARMGSERLPGKVLADIEGAPMLERVIERVERAETVDAVCVATSLSEADDAIDEWIQPRRGVHLYRGSEDDVLERYVEAAQAMVADVIVRITADCPLIDPEIIDTIVRYFHTNPRLEYATNTGDPRTYPRGLDVEAFTFESLNAVSLCSTKPYEREHVTPYYREDAGAFIKFWIGAAGTWKRPELRWCVDEQADLDFVREVYRRGWDALSTAELIKALDGAPELRDMNQGVRQKAVKENA